MDECWTAWPRCGKTIQDMTSSSSSSGQRAHWGSSPLCPSSVHANPNLSMWFFWVGLFSSSLFAVANTLILLIRWLMSISLRFMYSLSQNLFRLWDLWAAAEDISAFQRHAGRNSVSLWISGQWMHEAAEHSPQTTQSHLWYAHTCMHVMFRKQLKHTHSCRPLPSILQTVRSTSS